MGGRDDAGSNAFGLPRTDHEMTNPSGDPNQAVFGNAKLLGVFGVDPQRMAMANLREPFRICRARVDQRGNSKRGQQNPFVAERAIAVGLHVEVFPVNVTWYPLGSCILGPAPVFERGRVELELLRWGDEAFL